MTPQKFRNLVWRFYREHGRHDLPWRKDFSVYRVLVSEIMLQQTQVDRVIPYYTKFIQAYPTAKRLADAPLSDVLKAWQGLGYNRRAKMLHAAAKSMATQPVRTITDLEALPGVGPYTAHAVAAFAFNEDSVVIETNIRTVVIHHFFPDRENVSDNEIEEVLIKVLPKGKVYPVRARSSKSSGSTKESVSNGAREWYSALMDYGAHLKRSGISHNARSTTHVKQPAFKGSFREARGAVVRELSKGPVTRAVLEGLLGLERRAQLRSAIEALSFEGMIELKQRRYRLVE